MDKRAQEIIALRDRERQKQDNFRALWQETADLMFPRENQITAKRTDGEDKSRIYDSTAIMDSQDMASGLSAAFIPSGQHFFALQARDKKLNNVDSVRRYLAEATETTHEALFESNFMLQLNETIRSLVVFGTGNIFSEFDLESMGLNFKDYDIGNYQFLENSRGIVDTVIVTLPFTARQAKQEFPDASMPEIDKALKDPKTENDIFYFIHIVRPRKNRNPQFSDASNMPYESVFVCEKDQIVVSEGGFEENAFAVGRWMKSSAEKHGRGQGTEALADVRVLQQISKDFIECGNKWNNPPLEVDQSFEGTVRVKPGAINRVSQMGSIKAIDRNIAGNFPISKEMLEFQQEKVHKAFFKDIFVQLGDLKGDRRTTVEIIERIKEGLRRLALPVARMQSELFNPLITRCVLLLIRNGRIPSPPPELEGASFGIEYIGELALALRNQQAKGFQQWANFVAAMEGVFPGAIDNIDVDSAIKRMGESFGVNTDDIASEEEIMAKRQARQQAQQQQQMAMMAETAGKAYKAGSGKAEEGSPAAALMGAM
jgi:hypothetical protein